MQIEVVFLLAVVFVFGAIVGSFLNVCIYRIPAGLSIVSPRSRCPECGELIRWYQNVPILSWVFLRGACAFCRKPISIRYPLIEVLNGLFYVGVLLYYGLNPALPVYWLFVSGLLVISFIDLDHRIIPDVISLPGIIIGFVCSFMLPWVGWVDSVLGILLGGGILLLIAWCYQVLAGREGMGGGDIKLLAMIGAFLGWKAIFPVVFFASLIGTLVGVPLMLVRREGGRLAIPFGPFLSLGGILYLLWGPQIIHWYLGLFH